MEIIIIRLNCYYIVCQFYIISPLDNDG